MAKSRKVSSISKEFDGKEVQGKLIERSGLFGSKVSKEVFKMPGGGKHIEKTRTNKKGDVVSRMSKDTKVNPLVFFNKNKTEAYKKAGGEMAKFRKSLPQKGDGGRWHAPMVLPENTKTQSPIEGPINNPANNNIQNVPNAASSARKANLQSVPSAGSSNVPNAADKIKVGMQNTPRQKKGGSVRRKKK